MIEGFMPALDASGWYDDPDAVLLRSVGWILELVISTKAAAASARKQAGKPFCEATNRWARVVRLRCRLAAEQAMQQPSHLLAAPDKLLAAMCSKLSRYRYATVTLYSMHKAVFMSIDLGDTLEDRCRRFRLKQNRVLYLRISRKVLHGFSTLTSTHGQASFAQTQRERAASGLVRRCD